jgi:hypothetical protein
MSPCQSSINSHRLLLLLHSSTPSLNHHRMSKMPFQKPRYSRNMFPRVGWPSPRALAYFDIQPMNPRSRNVTRSFSRFRCPSRLFIEASVTACADYPLLQILHVPRSRAMGSRLAVLFGAARQCYTDGPFDASNHVLDSRLPNVEAISYESSCLQISNRSRTLYMGSSSNF